MESLGVSRVPSSIADFEEFNELLEAVGEKRPRTSLHRARVLSDNTSSEEDEKKEESSQGEDDASAVEDEEETLESSGVKESTDAAQPPVRRRITLSRLRAKSLPPTPRPPKHKLPAPVLAQILRKREFLSTVFFAFRMSFAVALSIVVCYLVNPPATSLPGIFVPIFALDRMAASVGAVTRKITGAVVGVAFALVINLLYYATVAIFFGQNYAAYYALNHTTVASSLLPFTKYCSSGQRIDVTAATLADLQSTYREGFIGQEPLYSLVSVAYMVFLTFLVYAVHIGIDVKFVASSIVVMGTMGFSTLKTFMQAVVMEVPDDLHLLQDWISCSSRDGNATLVVYGGVVDTVLQSLALSLPSAAAILLGCLCSALAILLPWPRLSSTEVFQDVLVAGELASMLFDTLVKDHLGAARAREGDKEKGREKARTLHLKRMVECAILKSAMRGRLERAKRYVGDMWWETWLRVRSEEEKAKLSNCVEALDLIQPFLQGMITTAKRVAYVSYKKSRKHRSRKNPSEKKGVPLERQHVFRTEKSRRPLDEPLDAVPVPWQDVEAHTRIATFVEPILRTISRDCRSLLAGFGPSIHKRKLVMSPTSKRMRKPKSTTYSTDGAFSNDLIERYQNSSDIVAELMQMNQKNNMSRSSSSANDGGVVEDHILLEKTTSDFISLSDRAVYRSNSAGSPAGVEIEEGRLSPMHAGEEIELGMDRTGVLQPPAVKAWEAESILDSRTKLAGHSTTGDVAAVAAFFGPFPFNDVMKRSLFMFDLMQYVKVVFEKLGKKEEANTAAPPSSPPVEEGGNFVLPSSWASLFSFRRRDVITAIRICVALVLASIFVVVPALRNSLLYPLWVPLFTNLLAFESVGATFRTSMDRILGVAVGTAFAYGTVMVQNAFALPREVLLVLFIFLTTFGVGGKSQLCRMSEFASVVAIIAVLQQLQFDYTPALGTVSAKSEISMYISERIGSTFVSTSIVIVVWNTLWPRRATSALRDDFRACLYDASSYIERGVARLHRQGAPAKNNSTPAKGRALLGRVVALYDLCDEAQMEPSLWRSPFPTFRYRAAVRALEHVVETSILLNNCLESALLDRRNFFLRRAGLLDHLTRLTALMAGTIFYSKYLRKKREEQKPDASSNASTVDERGGREMSADLEGGAEGSYEIMQQADASLAAMEGHPISSETGVDEEEVHPSAFDHLSDTTHSDVFGVSSMKGPYSPLHEVEDEENPDHLLAARTTPPMPARTEKLGLTEKVKTAAKKGGKVLKKLWQRGWSSRNDFIPRPPSVEFRRGRGKKEKMDGKGGEGGMKRETSYDKLKNAVRARLRRVSVRSPRNSLLRKSSKAKANASGVNMHEDVLREMADMESTYRMVCETLPRLVEQGAAFRPPSVKEMVAFNALFSQLRGLSDDVTSLGRVMDELQEAEIFTQIA